MARRNDHTREELKQIILQSALNIVEKQGVNGLTARLIAKDIGYAPGTIYNVFSTMDDLYIAVNSMILDHLYTVLSGSTCRSDKKTPIQNMKKMAALYREFAKNHRQHWLMLFTYALPSEKQAPQWYQDKISQLFEPLENLLMPYYDAKQTRKRKMAARVLWASIHGLCFLEETGKIPYITNQENPPDMAGYLIDNFIAGLTKT